MLALCESKLVEHRSVELRTVGASREQYDSQVSDSQWLSLAHHVSSDTQKLPSGSNVVDKIMKHCCERLARHILRY